MTLNEEKILKEAIKEMIRETIYDFFDNESKSSDDSNKKGKKNKKQKNKSRVLDTLKSKGINKAQFAYKLWPNKKKASARSYFYKCLKKKKNDKGDTYSFDTKETTDLRSLLNNQQL